MPEMPVLGRLRPPAPEFPASLGYRPLPLPPKRLTSQGSQQFAFPSPNLLYPEFAKAKSGPALLFLRVTAPQRSPSPLNTSSRPEDREMKAASLPRGATPATPTDRAPETPAGRPTAFVYCQTQPRPLAQLSCSSSKSPQSTASRARPGRHRALSRRGAGPGTSARTRLPRAAGARAARAPSCPAPESRGRDPGRLTLRQLHGARAAQRARQTVELLHRSLHPRHGLR